MLKMIDLDELPADSTAAAGLTLGFGTPRWQLAGRCVHHVTFMGKGPNADFAIHHQFESAEY
jgi:hypothetical protein